MITVGLFDVAPIRPEDYWSLCDFVVSNEDRLQRFFPLTLEQNLTPELAKRFTKLKAIAFAEHKEYLFTLKAKDRSAILGVFYIKALDWEKKQGELAYAISYTLEGKGITTQVLQELTKTAFQDLGLTTLHISVHREHAASIRVAEKCGFLWKKTLIKEFTPPGETPLDMELYELKY